MEQEYLIDTNVVIDYMSERFTLKALDFLDEVFNSTFYISIINKIELLGFKNLSSADEKQFQNFIQAANVIFLHDGIVEETISIRKKYSIKLPDAIIAASALSTNSMLITRNADDFLKISGLKLLNPIKLK
jgi:predicted nucleic acid-binding protein